MATSLDAARTYLKSITLTNKASVLLITDGQPNCNSALDPNTCVFSAAGCTPATCMSTDCLDDLATESAAAKVAAAGFPLYVVGLGTSTTTNQVLDAVAKAGGTSQAFIATDSTSLASALNSVAATITAGCK
jgi:hypothetical protein